MAIQRKQPLEEQIYYLHYHFTPSPASMRVENHYKFFNDYNALLRRKSQLMDNPLVQVLENGLAEYVNGELTPITK